MNKIAWNVVLAFLWLAITTEFTAVNFAAGFVIAYLVIVLSEGKRVTRGYGRQLVRILQFLLFYVGELILSNLRVAKDVLRLRPGTHPAIVAVPLEEGHTDFSITVLGNLVTMTPGTMTLDVSRDRRWLYIHAMFVEDVERFQEQFKSEFERRVLEAMG